MCCKSKAVDDFVIISKVGVLEVNARVDVHILSSPPFGRKGDVDCYGILAANTAPVLAAWICTRNNLSYRGEVEGREKGKGKRTEKEQSLELIQYNYKIHLAV